MSETTEAPPPRLPFWRTLAEAYVAFYLNSGVLLALVRPWMTMLLPLYIVFAWWSYPSQLALEEAVGKGGSVPSDPVATIASMLQWMVLLVPMSAIAIGWHRLLLRGEFPGGDQSGRLAGPIYRYVAIAAVIGIVGYGPLLLFEFVPAPADDEGAPLKLAALAAVLAAFAITTRLSLALPAIAVEGPGADLQQAWRVTRHNTLRLTLGVLLSLLPVMAVGGVTVNAAGWLPDRLSYAVVVGVLGVVALLLLTISVGFCSLAWRHFYSRWQWSDDDPAAPA